MADTILIISSDGAFNGRWRKFDGYNNIVYW